MQRRFYHACTGWTLLSMLVMLTIIVAVTTFTATAQETPTPTFSRDIAPIIFKNCTSCHRDGEVAPFPLTTYQQVRQRGQMIQAVTQSRYMPPWKPVRGYSEFVDSRSLSDQEIALMSQWVKTGMPEGDATQTPPVPTYPSGSQLGTPDLVLKMPQAYPIKGVNKDEYRMFVLPSGLAEGKVLSAIEFRPDNTKAVHHALIWADTSGAARALDAKDSGQGYAGFGGPGFIPSYFYFGWVPGSQARFLPARMGMPLPARSDLVVQVHYAPSAIEQTDQSSINIFFAKDTAKTRFVTIQNMSPRDLASNALVGLLSFVIPANKQSAFVGRSRVTQDLSLIAIAPHQHLLGRTAKAYAVTAKRDTIPLVRIDDWDFQWQGSYMFKHPIKIPAGSDIVYEASYDNTTENWRNPNTPPQTTRWGEKTSDEMYLCYFAGLPYQAGDENISLEGTQTATDVKAAMDKTNATVDAESIVLTCSPNPSSDVVSLTVELPKALPVWLDVVDMLGNRIATLSEGSVLGAGRISMPIDVSTWSSGVYRCCLRVGGITRSQPIIVTR